MPSNTKEYSRKYRLLNRTKLIENNRRWRDSHRLEIKTYRKEIRKTIKHRYNAYKYRAKSKNRVFEISLEEFNSLIYQPCHYCGESDFPNGIDRKDNNKGYDTENSLPCCWRCNKFKGSKDYSFFLEMCKKITKFRELG